MAKAYKKTALCSKIRLRNYILPLLEQEAHQLDIPILELVHRILEDYFYEAK